MDICSPHVHFRSCALKRARILLFNQWGIVGLLLSFCGAMVKMEESSVVALGPEAAPTAKSGGREAAAA
eukprot:scaffold273_cov242-Pinguiococcus_pyrenoidosus.AAC.18